MSHTDLATQQASPARRVQVTVTTLRTDSEDGCRQATAEGTFEQALKDALAQRLTGWAVEQVMAAVLARRPAAGEAIEYEDSFSPTRELHISIRPAGPAGTAVKAKRRRLPGLFIPAALWGASEEPPSRVVVQ
jgi:hypothetical protein